MTETQTGKVNLSRSTGNTINHVTINIHLHAEDPSALERLKGIINGYLGRGQNSIDSVASVASRELSQVDSGEYEG